MDLASLSSDVARSQQRAEREAVEAEILTAEGKLLDVKDHWAKTHALLMGNPRTDRPLTEKLTDLAGQQADLEDRIESLRIVQRRQAAEDKAFQESRVEIRALIDKVQAASDGEADAMREALASRLRSMVRKIVVFTAPAKIREPYQQGMRTSVDNRLFWVFFRNGHCEIVSPAAKDAAYPHIDALQDT